MEGHFIGFIFFSISLGFFLLGIIMWPILLLWNKYIAALTKLS